MPLRTDPCEHQIVRVVGFNALGTTVECIRCDDTYDVPAAKVEEDHYLFSHNSPKGEDFDIHILIHFRIIER